MEMERFGHRAFAPETKLESHVRGAFTYDIGKSMPDADCYVLQQRPEKFWIQLIPQLRAMGKIIVCETDDWYKGIPPGHAFWTNVSSKFKTRADVERRLLGPLHHIYSLADALTVSTPFLKRAYSYLNPNIHVVPNYLDWKMWEKLPKRNWDKVRIGWMGEAKMRPDDLRVLQGVIGPFLRRHPEVDFVAAGDPTVHDILDVPDGQRVSYERVLFDKLPTITATMDVGLVPLASHDFNEAKSYLKGLEYAACGIPCIASPSESYRDWVVEGGNGFLARQPRDWIRHLETLVSDGDLRRRLGRKARAKARANTIQKNAWRWDEVFRSLEGDWANVMARKAISKKALQKPSEFSAFLRYVEARPLQTVVEIGTAQGGTLWALCQLAADDALIISIDLPGGDKDEKSAKDKYGFRDTDKMASYKKEGQRLEFLQMDSHETATRATLERLLLGRGIDLLFVDGDHSYEGVRRDYELYHPLVAPEGLIAFHDILPHVQPGSDVDKLWGELRRRHTIREFSSDEDRGWGRWGGIGVIEMTQERIAA